jgi:hypothetical protein
VDECEPLIGGVRAVEGTETDAVRGAGAGQGFTLVHFSAHPEPFLTQNNTLHTPEHPLTTPTTPKHPLDTPEKTSTHTLYPTESAYVGLKSGRV